MRFRWISSAIVFVLCAVFLGTANGQTPLTSPVVKSKPKVVEPAKKDESWKKSWSVIVRTSGTFDSNFGKDPVAVRSVGVVPALELGYQIRSKRQRVKLTYSIGAPHYTNFEKYNRVGQYFAGAYRFDFNKNWSAESEAEALFKGTGEDRELNNQYIFTQNLTYRFARKNKINFYAAMRLKRKSEDAEQNSENPQFGVKFSRQLSKKLGWEIGYRYDKNRARGQRQRYIRRTFGTEFDYAPTGRDKFTFAARYAPRLYERTVRVGSVRVPRSDKKWTFGLGWRRDLTERFGFEARYEFETRDSNDADKIYRNHQAIFSLSYRWGNDENK